MKCEKCGRPIKFSPDGMEGKLCYGCLPEEEKVKIAAKAADNIISMGKK